MYLTTNSNQNTAAGTHAGGHICGDLPRYAAMAACSASNPLSTAFSTASSVVMREPGLTLSVAKVVKPMMAPYRCIERVVQSSEKMHWKAWRVRVREGLERRAGR
jgi:hypothetical protein